MANRRGSPIQLSPGAANFDQEAAPLQGLGAIDRPKGEAAGTIFQVSQALSDQVSKVADDLAKSEGKRGGLLAGADPDFKPTGTPTLRGEAFDKAGTDVFVSNLTAKFNSEAMDLYQKSWKDPEAFKNGFEQLTKTYEKDHLFPEAVPYFRTTATQLHTALRTKVLNNFEEAQNDQRRGELIVGETQAGQAQQRLLAAAPAAPETAVAVRRMAEERKQRVQASVQTGALTVAQGAKRTGEIDNETETALVLARAGDLKTPEEIDAYRAGVKKDFAAGKLPAGLSDWETVDAQIGKIADQRRTRGRQQQTALQTDLDDFVGRTKDGWEPGGGEWLKLQARGAQIGEEGQRQVAQAELKLKLARQLQALPLDRAEEKQAEIERQVRGDAKVKPAGLLAAGNIDLANRPVVKNADGTISTVRSMSIGIDGREVLIPTVSPDGKILSDADAVALYKKTGQHLGEFDTPQNATDYAQNLHKAQEARYGGNAGLVEVAKYTRSVNDARRNGWAQDFVGQGEREFGIQAGAVDFAGDVASGLKQRVPASIAMAQQVGRAPGFLRPEEKQRAAAELAKGGDAAIKLIDGVISGAGPYATQVLAEIGGDAPALAHAGYLKARTGDSTFARQVAEAQRARSVPGSKPPGPSLGDVDTAMRDTLGESLASLDSRERESTRAAVIAWSEVEINRRNLDPKNSSDVAKVLREGVLRARGMTGQGDKTYGGVDDYKPASWWYGNVKVQAPVDVRSGKFGDAIRAITDADLTALPSPPLRKDGKPATAADLRNLEPRRVEGGYTFRATDKGSGAATVLQSGDGKVFVLPWEELAPKLRQRVPGAFR